MSTFLLIIVVPPVWEITASQGCLRPPSLAMQADAVPARQTGGFVPETTNPFVTTTNPSEASNPWETKKPLKMLGWAKNEAERSQVSSLNTWWHGCCQAWHRHVIGAPK